MGVFLYINRNRAINNSKIDNITTNTSIMIVTNVNSTCDL